jgi:outer membrane protein assembly factor BamD (BamD/ComL family)
VSSRPHSRRHRARAATPTPSPAPQTLAPSPAPAPHTALTAQSLFDRANSARRAGRMLEASALYRELNTRFATSSEARVAIVLLARLQLDRGESESALAGFEAYLDSGHAALREQAMVGRAQALRRLGRDSEERAAVRELLRAYPDAPYARLARERLELEGP